MKIHARTPRPSADQWAMYVAKVRHGTSRRAADALGWCSEQQVASAVIACRAWIQDNDRENREDPQ